MDIKEVAEQFNIGQVEQSEQLTGGSINVSHKVETDKGTYIVQKLGKTIPGEATERYAQVEDDLRAKGIFVPQLLALPNGDHHAQNMTGHWRAFEYVPNDEGVIDKESCVISAAATLGRFHSIMSEGGKSFDSLVEHFHDTSYHAKQLAKHYSDSLPAQIKGYMSFLQGKAQVGLADYAPFPIHGDPKLANFLFRNSKVVAFIDLDTIMTANPLNDIGDAMRSWCCEDGTTFNESHFSLALEAYNANAPKIIDRNDAIGATVHIAAELGMRYLTDSFEQKVFSYDLKVFPSAKESNLAKTKNLVAYIGAIESIRE